MEIDLRALEITLLRVLAAEAEKRAPGPEASLLKIKGSEIQQMLTELTMMAAGPAALPHVREGENGAADVPWLSDEAFRFASGHYFNFRKTTIYGGSRTKFSATSSPRWCLASNPDGENIWTSISPTSRTRSGFTRQIH